MRWSIRRAVDADAPRIGEITVAGWRYAYRGIVADDRLDALDPGEFAEARRALIAAGGPAAVFVAEDGTEVRGYAVVGPPRRPDLVGEGPGPVGELQTLYLDPAIIGTGAGAALHDAGVAHLTASGYRRAVLWAYTGNASAERFYARRGWSVDGEPWSPPEWSAPATRWTLDLRSDQEPEPRRPGLEGLDLQG